MLRREVVEQTLYLWDLRDPERTPFTPGLAVPLAPFCGVMRIAPGASESHSTFPPHAAHAVLIACCERSTGIRKRCSIGPHDARRCKYRRS